MINKLMHGLIGYLIGRIARRYPTIAVIGAVTFGLYQVVERSAKHDAAYPEIREFGIGLAIGSAQDIGAVPRLRRYIDEHWADPWFAVAREVIRTKEPAEDWMKSGSDRDLIRASGEEARSSDCT